MPAICYDGKPTRWLVAWFGAYQLAHTITNTLGLAEMAQGRVPRFPVPPPAAGWQAQALPFFVAIAALDLAVALLSLVFVIGYFRQRPWCQWLGVATVTSAVFGHAFTGLATLLAGAWETHLAVYSGIGVGFLPEVVLFGLSAHRGLTHQIA